MQNKMANYKNTYFSLEENNKSLARILAQCKDKTVVLSGCGGGYDVFGAVYLLNKFKSAKAKQVVLANLSFTSHRDLGQRGECIMGSNLCYRINPARKKPFYYFPEAHLANSLRQPVYAFRGAEMSIEEIASCHRAILSDIDEDGDAVLVLIDGGCDVLLRGTEAGLGTPLEDMLHLRASMLVKQYDSGYICAIGADVDTAHGVDKNDLSARLNNLYENGAMLFAKCLSAEDNQNDDDTQLYCNIVSQCDPANTIVHSLAVAAIQGKRGYHTPGHLLSRIGKSTVELTNTTATYFIFDRDAIIQDNLYISSIEPQEGAYELRRMIRKLREDADSQIQIVSSGYSNEEEDEFADGLHQSPLYASEREELEQWVLFDKMSNILLQRLVRIALLSCSHGGG